MKALKTSLNKNQPTASSCKVLIRLNILFPVILLDKEDGGVTLAWSALDEQRDAEEMTSG